MKFYEQICNKDGVQGSQNQYIVNRILNSELLTEGVQLNYLKKEFETNKFVKLLAQIYTNQDFGVSSEDDSSWSYIKMTKNSLLDFFIDKFDKDNQNHWEIPVANSTPIATNTRANKNDTTPSITDQPPKPNQSTIAISKPAEDLLEYQDYTFTDLTEEIMFKLFFKNPAYKTECLEQLETERRFGLLIEVLQFKYSRINQYYNLGGEDFLQCTISIFSV